MKTINITFENKEFENLKRKKGKKSWHDFILKIEEQKPIMED